MNTKDRILKNIRLSTKNRNETLNELKYSYNNVNLLEKFQQSILAVSADFHFFSNNKEVEEIIQSFYIDFKKSINTVDDLIVKGIDFINIDNSEKIHSLDIAIIQGEFGVAENGAIWINVGELPNRIIPFICENLVVILDSDNIVTDMHEAYHKIDSLDYSYGVFMTGPSKTADIEQILVVGAQGPRKMLVLCKK